MKLFMLGLVIIIILPTVSATADPIDNLKLDDETSIIAVTPWLTEIGKLQCLITERRPKYENESQGIPPTRTLIIYKTTDDTHHLVYKEDNIGNPLSTMFQYDVYGRNLIIIWATGTVYTADIYSTKNDYIDKVLSVSSDYFPEIKLSRDKTNTIVSTSQARYVKGGQEVTFYDYAWSNKINKYKLLKKETKYFQRTNKGVKRPRQGSP